MTAAQVVLSWNAQRNVIGELLLVDNLLIYEKLNKEKL